MASIGCIAAGEGGGSTGDVDSSEAAIIATPPPPTASYEDVMAWCTANENGASAALGGATNPCAQMCATIPATQIAVAGAMFGVMADVTHSTLGILASCGADAAHIEHLLHDPWCAESPVACGFAVVAAGACCISEIPGVATSLGPLYPPLAAVCHATPILSAAIERGGLYSSCVQHIQNEISVPANPQQGCFCQREERAGRSFASSTCGPRIPWAEVGTAQANCRDHDSEYLSAAGPTCAGAGYRSGSTFYRYSNCRFIADAAADPAWCSFQQAFVDWTTLASDSRESACVCAREEMKRSGLLGSAACAPPTQVSRGVNVAMNRCLGYEDTQSGYLTVASPACGAANGTTWYRYFNCRTVVPTSPTWTAAGLAPPTTPPVQLVAGPECPALGGPGDDPGGEPVSFTGSGSGSGGDDGDGGSGSGSGSGSGY